MDVYSFDPLTDPRWPDFAAAHPDASIFHQRQWLAALRRTYGYRPLGLTSSSSAAALRDALVMCQVSSWLTGTRLVSVPFADHCDPLVDEGCSADPLLDAVARSSNQGLGAYLEVRPHRPLGACPAGAGTSDGARNASVSLAVTRCRRDGGATAGSLIEPPYMSR